MSSFNAKDIGKVVVMQAQLDKNMGEKRIHFVFPEVEGTDGKGVIDHLAPVVGGLYISKDVDLPDTIIIQLKKVR